MRTFGRISDEYGNRTWVKVETDENGFNDNVYITSLIQVLKLNLEESPFFANFGIPAQQSVMTQVYPDYYINYIQNQYAKYFANLRVEKVNSEEPYYNIVAVTNLGSKLELQVPV